MSSALRWMDPHTLDHTLQANEAIKVSNHALDDIKLEALASIVMLEVV